MQARMLLLLVITFFGGCLSPEDKALKEIKTKQEAVHKNNGFDVKLGRELVLQYEDFARDYPKAKETPGVLFNLGNTYFSLGEFENAVKAFQKLAAEYPDFKKENVLFMQAYIYENFLNKLEEAKGLYEKFIQLYPDHEFAQSARFSLENLGKPAEQIFLEKRWGEKQNAAAFQRILDFVHKNL